MTDTRLNAYTPNGSSLGALPTPQGLDASFVLNDTGALSFAYPPDAPGVALLGQPLEIAVQVSTDDGATWTEPPSARFLLLRDGRDPVKGDAYQVDCPSYIFRLSKGLVPFTGLDSQGNRAFTAATPGKILNDLMTEAQVRGALAGMTWTFTAAVDSAGTAWPVGTQQAIGYTPGTNFLEILSGLADAGLVDFRTNGREIQVYVAESTAGMAADRTIQANNVTLRNGQALTEAPFRRTWEALADTAYVQGDGTSSLIRTNGAAITPWGRQETFVTAGGATDVGTLTTVGDGALSQTDAARIERTYGMAFATAVYKPFRDFAPGEWVFGVTDGLVAAERMRVRSITLSRDANGVATGNAVLNDRFQEADIRMAKTLAKATNGATIGGSGSAPVGNDILPPAAVGVVTTSSSAYLDIHGDVKATLGLDWPDVTTNSDGTAAGDIDHYDVHRRRSGETTWTKVDEVNLSQWSDSPYEPNETWEFRVCAVDSVYNRGAFSATVAKTTASDVTGPVAPSQPSGSSLAGADQGSIVIGWDGKNNVGGPMDADLDYVEVHVSTTTGFTATGGNAATMKALFPDRAPNTTEIGGLIEGTTYYVVLKGRDTSGNYGAQSVQRAVIVAKATDGAAPSAPPANTALVQFGVGSLEAKWDAVTNADPVTYDVYLNEGSAVAVFNSTTFVGSTNATRLPISRKADGTVLLPTTDYYVAVKARDGDGTAAGQGTAGPTQYRKADVATIAADWVYANTVEASQVQSGSVTADWALLGSISVGTNITLKPPTVSPPDPGGLKIITSSGAGLILLPGDGSAALFRKVAIEADSLLVYDNFESRGVNNKISGTMKLSKGVEAFPAGPTVVSDWTDTNTYITDTSTGVWAEQLDDDGTRWVALRGAGSSTSTIIGINKTTGAESTLLTLAEIQAFTRASTTWYVLDDTNVNGLVRTYSSSWVAGATFAAPATPANCIKGGIAYDPVTNLLYFSFYRADTDLKYLVYSTTLAGASPTLVWTSADAPGNGNACRSMWVGSADFGAQRFVFPGHTLSGHKIYTAAGARATTQEWAAPNGETPRGVYYDGTNFREITNVGSTLKVWKLSPVVTSLARSVRASKYDSVGTVHETAWSPATAFTQNPREWMKVQTSAPDGSGGADEPNRIRHYVQTASLSASYFLQPDVTTTPWAAWYGTPATGTATAVTGVDFSSVSAVGQIADSTGAYYFKGNGDAAFDDVIANTITTDGLVLPHLNVYNGQRQTVADANFQNNTATLVRWTATQTADATGTITNPNSAVAGDGRIVLGKAGLYQIILRFTFASSTAGTTRRANLLLNGATVIDADSRIQNGAQGTSLEVVVTRRFAAADYLTTEVLQVSGGVLATFGGTEPYTHLQVTRLAA